MLYYEKPVLLWIFGWRSVGYSDWQDLELANAVYIVQLVRAVALGITWSRGNLGRANNDRI